MVFLSLYILYEGFRRIFEPPEIQSFPMIIVASIGLIMNLIGMRLLGSISSDRGGGGGGHSHWFHQEDHHEAQQEDSLNIKAAYFEVLSDTLGSAGVIAAGIIILATKFYLADPVISIGIALFILPRTWSIMKKAIHILMEGSPPNISHEKIKNAILQIKGVTGVFELHIWTITSGMHALSAHVVVIDTSKSHLK
jgi:cobalt-zinc-cadmium efflux system protein